MEGAALGRTEIEVQIEDEGPLDPLFLADDLNLLEVGPLHVKTAGLYNGFQHGHRTVHRELPRPLHRSAAELP